MGKKFIDKKNSQKFHLLHRSQSDVAHAQEGVPSEFVLVPVTENGDVIFQTSGEKNQHSFKRNVDFHDSKDHVNELGFANDGYDYSKHLKEMGGGKYISKDGKVMENVIAVPSISLPSDVLPSEQELQRDYEAITITHELMDDDLRAALFEGFDEAGEFEPLDDDFVNQVMTEPTELDFDFDQHIANLIARSEQRLGINKQISKKNAKFGNEYDDDESGYEVESWIDDEELKKTRNNGNSSTSVLKGKADFTDDQLEQILESYDDDQIGELEKLDEADVRGEIDEENDVVQSALDEFLKEQENRLGVSASSRKKGGRSSIVRVFEEEEEEEESKDVNASEAYKRQLLLQRESEEQLKQFDQQQESIEDILNSQEYLKESKIQEEWDCETIISTYSTLDNHPKLIKSAKIKFQPFQSLKKYQASYRSMNNINSSEEDGMLATQGGSKPFSVLSPSKIVLSGKLNLPEGFSKYSSPRIKQPHQQSLQVPNTNLSATNETVNDTGDEVEEKGDKVSSNEGSEDEERPGKTEGKRKESKEEKKQRKLAVKEQRRQKRTNKKILKTVFRKEGLKIIQSFGKEESTNHVSVFKFSH